MTRKLRNLLSVVPKAAQETIGAVVQTILLHAHHASAMAQLREVAGMLRERFP